MVLVQIFNEENKISKYQIYKGYYFSVLVLQSVLVRTRF
jgi:hypothetical protein